MTRDRWLGLAAVLGGIGCLAAPLLLRFGYGMAPPPVVLEGVVPPLAGAVRLVADRPSLNEYALLGELFFVVELLTLAGVLGTYPRLVAPGGLGRLGRVGLRVLVGGLGLAALAGFGIFMSPDNAQPTALWSTFGLGYYLEPFALLGVLVGSVLVGLASLRARAMPAWAGWLLVLAGPAGALNTFVLQASVPRGTMLPVSLAWALIGAGLLLGRERRPLEARPATA